MNYEDHIDQDRRLVILRLLKSSGGYANESNIETGLKALGHRAGLNREKVRDYMRWLAKRDAITIEMVEETVMVATLTERGHDAATGVIEIAGVKHPRIIEGS